MGIINSIILGLIQGLSEFIPISSTAHLTVAGHLMGLINPDAPEKWTSFIAVVQMGTLLAVLVYFFRDIKNIVVDFLKQNLGSSRKQFKEQSINSKMGWYVIFGSIPIVVIGFGLKKIIEGAFTKNLIVIACSLIVLAVILAIAEKTVKFKKNYEDITLKDAILIGCAQCVALIPGASRSGTTITAGLFLSINRDAAARFSFLLSIPAVFGSGVLEFLQSLKYITQDELFSLLIATIIAGISGYLSIAFLLKYLKNHSTFLFINYRIAAGMAIILLVVLNLI